MTGGGVEEHCVGDSAGYQGSTGGVRNVNTHVLSFVSVQVGDGGCIPVFDLCHFCPWGRSQKFDRPEQAQQTHQQGESEAQQRGLAAPVTSSRSHRQSHGLNAQGTGILL